MNTKKKETHKDLRALAEIFISGEKMEFNLKKDKEKIDIFTDILIDNSNQLASIINIPSVSIESLIVFLVLSFNQLYFKLEMADANRKGLTAITDALLSTCCPKIMDIMENKICPLPSKLSILKKYIQDNEKKIANLQKEIKELQKKTMRLEVLPFIKKK